MGTTNTQKRAWIDRIIEIKDLTDELAAEKRVLATKLGMGTYRSRTYIGRLVRFAMGAGGWRVQWKEVAKSLAKQLKMSDADLTKATWGHRKMTHATPTVSVGKDTARVPNLTNPNINFI